MSLIIYGPGISDPLRDAQLKQTDIAATHAATPARAVQELESSRQDREIQAYKNHRQLTDQNNREPIYAFQIMHSPVVSLSEQASIADAWQLMQAARLRHIPIVNPLHQALALLSEHHLLLYLAAGGSINSARPALSIANHDYPRIFGQMVLAALTAEILRHDSGCALVVNDQQQLTGIITRTDLLQTLMQQQHLEGWG